MLSKTVPHPAHGLPPPPRREGKASADPAIAALNLLRLASACQGPEGKIPPPALLDEGGSPAPLCNVQFIRCRTCGRYLSAASAVQERYCSPECAVEYASCRNCGRFYPAGSGHGGLYCSRECAVRYRLGARPITGLPEEHT